MKLPAAMLSLLLPILSSCSRSAPVPSEPSHSSQASTPEVTLTEAAAGQTVALKSGQRFRIVLPENPSTGYRWILPEPCAEHLEVQSDSTEHGDAQVPGAPGTRTWLLQAKGSGTCEVKLESARSWEKSATGRTVSFPLRIEP